MLASKLILNKGDLGGDNIIGLVGLRPEGNQGLPLGLKKQLRNLAATWCVGIDLGRAQTYGRFHKYGDVSQGLPMIPDRRFSRVRF